MESFTQLCVFCWGEGGISTPQAFFRLLEIFGKYQQKSQFHFKKKGVFELCRTVTIKLEQNECVTACFDNQTSNNFGTPLKI